jgi:hypothetical protein
MRRIPEASTVPIYRAQTLPPPQTTGSRTTGGHPTLRSNLTDGALTAMNKFGLPHGIGTSSACLCWDAEPYGFGGAPLSSPGPVDRTQPLEIAGVGKMTGVVSPRGGERSPKVTRVGSAVNHFRTAHNAITKNRPQIPSITRCPQERSRSPCGGFCGGGGGEPSIRARRVSWTLSA